MPEFLEPFSSASPVAPLEVFVRLLIALALGGVVAWIYRKSRTEFTATFPATLVLLAVLIAMVTQVIGDSVARAFSLVGALSIVRFRTVVRDTQDTAFVIFSVVVGMACGAADPRIALIGIGVVGAAAFIMKPKSDMLPSTGSSTFLLSVRIATGHDLDTAVGKEIDALVSERRLVSVGTARQGIALEASYTVKMRNGRGADELVKVLNRIEGIQNVTVALRENDDKTL
jgi:hypothetical protein